MKINLFLVGEPKTGTSAIAEYLKEHPDVFVSKLKEPHYFCSDFNKNRLYGSIAKEEYFQLFAKTDKKYLGDFSVGYINSETSAKEIHAHNPGAKIIYGVREPVSFLKSLHHQLIKSGDENVLSFKKAIQLSDSREEGKKIPRLASYPEITVYKRHIRFAQKLQRYLDFFPAENILVYEFKEFKDDNQAVLDRICEFLEIDKIKVKRREVNNRTTLRFLWLRRSYKSIVSLIAKPARKVFSYETCLKIKRPFDIILRKITMKEGAQADKKSAFDSKLRKEFLPEVKKINKLLHNKKLYDKDLVKIWGYDKI